MTDACSHTAGATICSTLRAFALALAAGVAAPPAHAADDFLPPEVAFKPTVTVQGERTLDIAYTIAPGYYLYRDKLQVAAADAAVIDPPVTPAGHVKFDETFQKNVETYRTEVHVPVVVRQAGSTVRLTVSAQGCADKGLCYPPQDTVVEVGLVAFGGDGAVHSVTASGPFGAAPGTTGGQHTVGAPNPRSEPSATPTPAEPAGDGAGRLDAVLHSGSFWGSVVAFFAAGVLLSLTPCVLPMLPILSSIIVGQQSGGAVSRGRGLALAAAYSLGMALVYTLLGVLAGLAGEGLAAQLQHPAVLAVFALGLAGLATAMLTGHDLRLPAALTDRLSSASNRMSAGRYAGVFAMGGLSALIVSPCVAAPLAGALLYLSQTHDVVLGGAALFALAAGMSLPLLALGASAGALLPKAGAWMDDVKRLFGLLLLAVAVWTVQPIVPPALPLAAWGALLLAAGAVLMAGRPAGRTALLRPAVAAVAALWGGLQLVGAASGGTDPFEPLAHLARPAAATAAVDDAPLFTTIRTAAELDAQLGAGRPVVLDFYADWCKSCKEMDATTYADPAVRRRLRAAVLLKADVTANTPDQRAVLKRYQLFGPPGTLFFDAVGHELPGTRVIGYQDKAEFLRSLDRARL